MATFTLKTFKVAANTGAKCCAGTHIFDSADRLAALIDVGVLFPEQLGRCAEAHILDESDQIIWTKSQSRSGRT